MTNAKLTYITIRLEICGGWIESDVKLSAKRYPLYANHNVIWQGFWRIFRVGM